MKTLALALLAAFALAPMAQAQAETSPAAKTQSAHKAPVKKKVTKKAAATKKQPAKKPRPTAKKPQSKVKKAAMAAPALVQTPTERLTETELALAPRVYTGDMRCGQGADVAVTPDAENPGYFRVAAGKLYYYMHPVVSKTGAIRLEDNRAGAVWLQLGNKSMLLDQKKGGLVADDCTGAVQRDYAANMSQHPAPDLLGLHKK